MAGQKSPTDWRAVVVFRYSISTVLVIAFVVAGTLPQAERQRNAVEAIRNVEGHVVHDYQFALQNEPFDAAARLKALRGDLFGNVTYVNLAGTSFDHVVLGHLAGMTDLEWVDLSHRRQTTDATLKQLKGLTKLERLDIDSTEVTDAGLKHLSGLTNLESLSLSHTKVTSPGLENLKGLKRLEYLSLYGRKVTDAGFAYIKGLTALEHLSLRGTYLTDAGLTHLKGLANLKIVDVTYSVYISEEGIEELRKALPNCTILGPKSRQIHRPTNLETTD